MYDKTSSGYDELHGDEQLRKLRIIYEKLALPKDAKVLDVGAGTGLSGKLDWDVTGVEPSQEMAEKATMPMTIGSAENLPFPDKSFDAVICVTVFHHIKDKEKALDEMKRVSTGPIVISLLRKSESTHDDQELIAKVLQLTLVIPNEKDFIIFCH